VYLNALLELLTALLEYLDLFTEIYCIYKSLITIIITNAVGINGMRAGDGKQGIGLSLAMPIRSQCKR